MSKERDSKNPRRDELPAERGGVQRKIQAFLRALAAGGGKPFEQMTPSEGRAALAALQSSVTADLPDADVAGRTITSGGQTVKLVVVRPAGLTGPLPAFMFFPGGGWVLGDFSTHERRRHHLAPDSRPGSL